MSRTNLEFLIDQPELAKKRKLYEECGVIENPFPSASQTTGHPRMSTEADEKINSEIVDFYNDGRRNSHAIVVTATQGIGKTNLLNEYERQLRKIFEPRGFFIIRYVPDPEPTFDPLMRTIFDAFSEDHLKKLASVSAKKTDSEFNDYKNELRSRDMQRMINELRVIGKENDNSKIDDFVKCAQEWLSGFPIRKIHRELLKIRFRLDTVESKIRTLRDLVTYSYSLTENSFRLFEGIFLLLDELEKQGSTLSTTMTVRYLSALRALIDALPSKLFLMVAITSEALDRYREMLPALRGRLANIIELKPLQNSEEAIKLYNFYLEEARESAIRDDLTKKWKQGNRPILQKGDATAMEAFEDLQKRSSIKGVRQRDFLNALHQKAQEIIEYITQHSG
jgi:hypothetical protein